MRFYRGSIGSDGQIRGYSYGLVWASIRVFFGIFVTAVIIGLPLMIHGPVGWLLEIPWLILMTIVGLVILGMRESKGQHTAPRPGGRGGQHRAAYQAGLAPGAMGLRDLDGQD